MSREALFDPLAASYDADFTNTEIGRLQRARVRKFLTPYINSPPQQILEINCGTGEDAIWLASLGHHVKATDLSKEMISIAKQKQEQSKSLQDKIEFEVSSFNDLIKNEKQLSYDLIFSNFSGLNCCSEIELRKLDDDFGKLLKPGGKLVVVLFGKYCIVERLYFLLRDERDKAGRRMKKAKADLGNGISQPTFYYSTAELSKIFASFTTLKRKAVGLFIPPSWLEKKMNAFYLAAASALDSMFSRFSILADFGDHIFIAFEKKETA